MKKTLWKDILRTIKKSKGRYFSIMALMLIGSFALVGLTVTGPNMRATGERYFDDLNTSDLTVIGSLGLDSKDLNEINKINDISTIEYGYLKDVVIKDTNTSLRIFSKGKDISDYELVDGNLPASMDQIALDSSYKKDYKVGDKLEITEESDIAGNKLLKTNEFIISGFVNSGEIISRVNQGQSTAGTGSLNGYGLVKEEVFDSDIYMLARISYKDLKDVDPYSIDYTNRLQSHKEQLEDLLKNQPNIRIASVKAQVQEKIDDGQKKINESKNTLEDAKNQLSDGDEKLKDGKNEIEEGKREYELKIAEANRKMVDGENKIKSYESKIEEADKKLLEGKNTLDEKKGFISKKEKELNGAENQLNQAVIQLEEGEDKLNQVYNSLEDGKKQIEAGYRQIDLGNKEIKRAGEKIGQVKDELSKKENEYKDKKLKYLKEVELFNEKKDGYQDKKDELDQAKIILAGKEEQLEAKNLTYLNGIKDLKSKINKVNTDLDKIDLSEEEINGLEAKLVSLQAELKLLETSYEDFNNTFYQVYKIEIDKNKEELILKEKTLKEAKDQLDSYQLQVDSVKLKLESGEKELLDSKKLIKLEEEKLNRSISKLEEEKKDLDRKSRLLDESEKEYKSKLEEYKVKVKLYEENQAKYNLALKEISNGKSSLKQKEQEYLSSYKKNQDAKNTLSDKKIELLDSKNKLEQEKKEGLRKISEAEEELGKKQGEYNKKNEEFLNEKIEADRKIEDHQKELDKAQDNLDNLSLPSYALNSRREMPGGEGYTIYSNISETIDSLANIFPIFLYFVAALVTLTTMTRFVDEERIKTGTLKALGYENKDVLKKFVFYGMTSGLSGTILGIILGHTLMPFIVYNAYGNGFSMPNMEMHFYWKISAIAVILALLSSVLPVLLAASKELKENPSSLLVAKAPSGGSKILLERIKFIWDKMSFTHKVTARNIFRYKKRMMMTIFGVAGAVSLLFAGFSVKDSIGGINDRQFGEIINYDMVVALNEYLPKEETIELDKLLNNQAIDSKEAIHFEEIKKVAGSKKDTQSIKLFIPSAEKDFSSYVNLVNRKNKKKLNITDDGIIISERLADLLEVDRGDEVSFYDKDNKEIKLKVSDITEMYMGHFAFASENYYEETFSKKANLNAYLVKLEDSSDVNTKKIASQFMNLDGVKSVIQNTALTSLIETIVHSLDKIMTILIVVAAMLAIVILYNLTNINVSERMRELSTIKVLGFYDKEVTMYIYRETILLTLLGILVGFGMGEFLHQYIIKAVSPNDVMFNPALSAISFLVPAMIIIVVTSILALVINKRLKNVDMLEALKSVE